jgi:hypothetical protein
MNIDFSKYKRFFAFGCSFTGYNWPTWADILSKEMPQAEFYNMGYSGAGNLMISARITEASIKFKFCETDLLMPMWTTFCREDRYFHNAWSCPGNIFTQQTYSEDFVKKFADPKGYLIRDLALITLTTGYLKSLPCDIIPLASVPYNYQNEDDASVLPILESYKDITNQTPPCLFELEMNNHWTNGHEYYDPNHGHRQDYHPDPLRYRSYLEKLGMPLTDLSQTFAQESYNKLKQTKTKDEILKTFPNNSSGSHQFKGWF